MTQGETGPGNEPGMDEEDLEAALTTDRLRYGRSVSFADGTRVPPCDWWTLTAAGSHEDLSQLDRVAEQIGTLGPVAVRMRVAFDVYAAIDRLPAAPRYEASPLGVGIAIVIDDALPLGLAHVEMSDGTVRVMDLRRAADAREET